MFCFHKYDKIEDGFQYCKKCGKAKKAPCIHFWEICTDNKDEDIIVSRCKNCGKLHTFCPGNPIFVGNNRM